MRFQKAELETICSRLTKYDSKIVEIIQFGSSVYAPESAMDLDILVFTKQKKDYSGYLDAIDGSELPYDVDVVVKEMDGHFDKSFAVSVFGAHKVLYGDGHCLEKQFSEIDPTSEEVYSAANVAQKIMEDAKESEVPEEQDRYIKIAFNELFHASRLAAMTYLSTEETRWGRVKRTLPKAYQDEFERYINTLHVDYFYYGKYPKENVEAEFEKWTQEVKRFITSLREEGDEKKSD
jgi:hypothetical protein